MEELTLSQVKELILQIAQSMMDHKEELTAIDAKIGDGDHGIGMEFGFTKVREKLLQTEYDTINALYHDAGMQMLTAMGGASGVLFSSLFLDAFPREPALYRLTLQNFVQGYENALRSIQDRGKAQIGDKTMVDALAPAVAALKQAEEEKASLTTAFEAAALAAKAGVESTKEMVARFGRAKSLGERSLGYPDAGAASIYFWFAAIVHYLKVRI